MADPDGRMILWSRHGIMELAQEGWLRSQVEDGLQACEVIEEYAPTHRPLPDCLVLGRMPSGEPFHAVVGIDEPNDRLFMITVYAPSRKEWKDDLRTRKR